MRLLANENVPRDVVVEMRRRGHDVLWMHEEGAGLPDRFVLERALREERLLVTFDKDFGELAFGRGLAASPGVVLFRIETASGAEAAQVVASVLEGRDDWIGNFAVVEPGRVRMRPLPPPPME